MHPQSVICLLCFRSGVATVHVGLRFIKIYMYYNAAHIILQVNQKVKVIGGM